MDKRYCDIVKDLLPLYEENICSENSRCVIEEHLKECEECRTYYEAMTKEPPKIVLDTSNDLSEEKFFQKIDKSIHRKITQNTIIASFVLFIVLAIGLTFIPRYPNRPGFGMYGFVDERVEKEKLKVENLCQLEDGRIYFEMVCTETVTGLHIETDLYNEQNDSFYGIANYSIDRKKQCFGVEGNGSRYWFVFLPYLEDEFGNRHLVTEFFFECKDDERIEIWKRGQEIEKASEEIEVRVQSENLDVWCDYRIYEDK